MADNPLYEYLSSEMRGGLDHGLIPDKECPEEFKHPQIRFNLLYAPEGILVSVFPELTAEDLRVIAEARTLLSNLVEQLTTGPDNSYRKIAEQW